MSVERVEDDTLAALVRRKVHAWYYGDTKSPDAVIADLTAALSDHIAEREQVHRNQCKMIDELHDNAGRLHDQLTTARAEADRLREELDVARAETTTLQHIAHLCHRWFFDPDIASQEGLYAIEEEIRRELHCWQKGRLREDVEALQTSVDQQSSIQDGDRIPQSVPHVRTDEIEEDGGVVVWCEAEVTSLRAQVSTLMGQLESERNEADRLRHQSTDLRSQLTAAEVQLQQHVCSGGQGTYPQSDPRRVVAAECASLEHDITHVLNCHSAENASNTPDYILAQYLLGCLAAWNTATQQRETWYGRDARPTFLQPEGATAPVPVPNFTTDNGHRWYVKYCANCGARENEEAGQLPCAEKPTTDPEVPYWRRPGYYKGKHADDVRAAQAAPPADTPGAETGCVTLNECPVGLFWYGRTLGFKSEYYTDHSPDAYVVESGEYFWDALTSARSVRDRLLVQPVTWPARREGE